MRVKKAQPPARSMRYLLSVDRSLRRISLRKIPVRVKKANNRVRSSSPTKGAARETKKSSKAASVTNGWTSSRTIALALIGIVAAATLIGAPGLFQGTDSTIAAVRWATSASQATLPPAPPLDTTKAATELVATTAAAPRMRTPDSSAVSNRPVESPRSPAVESTPHVDATAHAAPTPPPAESKRNAEPRPHAEPLTSADVNKEGGVTISGCLQAGDDSFWLKDTSGADAPKSRSWKSGFLKKRGGSVHVVDATNALQLSNYVGQRVTATGSLANRTLQARSLERVAASCN